jgi:ketosteroid isomerase-like protein
MCNQNEWIVREAFLAYERGDVARMMDFVDPDLEWTYLDPGRRTRSRRSAMAARSLRRPRAAGGPGAAGRAGRGRRRR